MTFPEDLKKVCDTLSPEQYRDLSEKVLEHHFKFLQGNIKEHSNLFAELSKTIRLIDSKVDKIQFHSERVDTHLEKLNSKVALHEAKLIENEVIIKSLVAKNDKEEIKKAEKSKFWYQTAGNMAVKIILVVIGSTLMGIGLKDAIVSALVK